MKPLLLFSLSLILFTSCKKDFTSRNTNSVFLSNVKVYLKDSLSENDFANLNFSEAIITNPDSATNFLRISFKGVKISEQFVVIKTHANGKILRGSIINLHKDATESKTRLVYNGSIEIESLTRRDKIQSRIINGYVSAFHLYGSNPRSLVVPSEANVLPEVVVTCYIDGGDRGINYTDWISLVSLLGAGNSGYYSSLDGGGGGGGVSGSGITDNNGYVTDDRENIVGGGGDANITNDNEILVDFEPVENLSPIDIAKYLKYFSSLPDDGSVCSIEILADIPVDKDPNKLMSWETGSPGHTFIQLKKIKGSQIVMQNIGFYPVGGWKTLLTNAPVAG